MAGSTVLLPPFNFSAFYYAQILEALLEYKRQNIPEISNENPFETGVQLLRAFALVGHLNNVNVDITALEMTLPTAQLLQNVINLLKLIDFRVRSNIPATTTLRAQLTRGYSTTTLIVPELALFGTRRRANTPSLLFEAQESLSVSATDVLSGAWVRDETNELWKTEATTRANTDAFPFTVNRSAGQVVSLYVGHDSAFTDTVDFSGITAFDIGDDRTATPVAVYYQFFDGSTEDTTPDSVVVQPSNLRVELNGLLGTNTKADTYAHVTLNATGATERLKVQWDGVNFVETSAFLSQTTVSTDVEDYTVGTPWKDVQLATNTTEAAPTVAGETFDNGDGIAQSFTQTLDRWPLEPDTIVTWTYTAGAVPKTAVYDLSTGTFSGDANIGTTVNPATGVSTLNTISVPDAAVIQVAYSRKAQPFQQDGQVTFLPPFNDLDNWINSAIPDELRGTGGPTGEFYWFRVVMVGWGAGSTTSLTLDRVKWDQGGMYVRIPVTQGRTVTQTLGDGDGTPSQSFTLPDSPVIEDSIQLIVDDENWTEVSNFFASSEVDEHYTTDINSEGVGSVEAGDGLTGRVIPVGTNNVEATYRIGASDNGNVGAGQIEVSRTGISRVKNTTNPRAATGWVQQEGSDDLGLAKLKRDGPASLRTLTRAVAPYDVEYLTTRWEYGGQSPFSRARAIENGFGLKTIKNIVVPVGGGSSSATVRQALDKYFNGDINEGGTETGVLVVNQRVTSVDYTPKLIAVTVTVTGGDEGTIRAALIGALQPEAQREDTSWRWDFGQTVTTSALIGLITAADRDVTDVVLSVPAANVTLADDELPLLDTDNFSLTVV